MSQRKRVISRRQFCQSAALGLGGLAVGGCFNRPAAAPELAGALLQPITTGNSVEVCLNSRISHHSVLTGTATDQQIANVLWAAGRAPVTGSFRTIYLKTAAGTYVYDPANHALQAHSGETVAQAARLNFDRERDFDAGVSYIYAILASVSLWTGTKSQLAGCPQIGDLNFGIADVPGLTSEIVAVSSDGSLPSPATDGTDKLEDVLANLQLSTQFGTTSDLTVEEISQILWAGYGCSPHTIFNGGGGLTVPSWVAQYFLTNRIYVVDARVSRYSSRQGADFSTRDHRLEPVSDADVRSAVQAALPDLPPAPCYVLLCLSRTGLDTWYQRLETGFVAGAMSLQAGALGLGCAFKSALSAGEQGAVQNITQIPTVDYPHAVVAIGQALT